MIEFLLAASLLGPPTEDVAVLAGDLPIIAATEEFVIDTLPRPFVLAGHMPRRVADLIAQLDNDCCHCRDIAAKKLNHTRDVSRWLVWAEHHPSLEVRYRASLILRAKGGGWTPCFACNATGKCNPVRRDDGRCARCGEIYDQHWSNSCPCIECDSTGRFMMPIAWKQRP